MPQLIKLELAHPQLTSEHLSAFLTILTELQALRSLQLRCGPMLVQPRLSSHHPCCCSRGADPLRSAMHPTGRVSPSGAPVAGRDPPAGARVRRGAGSRLPRTTHTAGCRGPQFDEATWPRLEIRSDRAVCVVFLSRRPQSSFSRLDPAHPSWHRRRVGVVTSRGDQLVFTRSDRTTDAPSWHGMAASVPLRKPDDGRAHTRTHQ
jgi:hypothetical protein